MAHYQAITTKYLGPTNHRGARIKAQAARGHITLEYDSGLTTSANHMEAAKALAERFGWGGHWASGGLPDGRGDVFVIVENNRPGSMPSFVPAFSTVQREA